LGRANDKANRKERERKKRVSAGKHTCQSAMHAHRPCNTVSYIAERKHHTGHKEHGSNFFDGIKNAKEVKYKMDFKSR
jgi:hypothetical protein